MHCIFSPGLTAERLARGPGRARRSRSRDGLRALLAGPSGTGETLAAGSVASRSCLPLQRLDLAGGHRLLRRQVRVGL